MSGSDVNPKSAEPGLCVLYDFLQVPGGAERVSPSTDAMVQALAQTQTQALPVQAVGWRWARPLGWVLQALLSFRWGRVLPEGVLKVVYSGFYAPLAVHGQRTGWRVYYGHTVPRFAYDLRAHFRAQYPWFLRPFFDVFTWGLRHMYRRALLRMDVLVVNSENVRLRLQRHLGLQAQVVHPPVDVARFAWLADGDYFVSTARLEPLKRVDVLVQAFLQMPHERLVVCSGGSELGRLQALAAGAANISFTGWSDELQMAQWVGRARASLYVPVDEDFGMSPVESMAAGKPVIGVAEGGLLETVVHGETGLLLPPEFDASDVRAAVQAMTPGRAQGMRQACEARSKRFDTAQFVQRMREVLAGPHGRS
jgi:glycosyltransferase involved in cell wall biosynthesis